MPIFTSNKKAEHLAELDKKAKEDKYKKEVADLANEVLNLFIDKDIKIALMVDAVDTLKNFIALEMNKSILNVKVEQVFKKPTEYDKSK